MFVFTVVRLRLGGMGGETIGTKGAKFEVASFNIIVRMAQNRLHS
jgi:hypothetical protein